MIPSSWHLFHIVPFMGPSHSLQDLVMISDVLVGGLLFKIGSRDVSVGGIVRLDVIYAVMDIL